MRVLVKHLILNLILIGWLGNDILAQSSYKEIQVNNGGMIKGFVFIDGDYSFIRQYSTTKDPAVCGKSKPYARLIVGKNKGIKNTIVYLEGITEGKKIVSRQSFSMNQQRCEYSPHIMILPRNSNLEIVNSDPILHNVHAYDYIPTTRSMFNIAQPVRGQRTKIKENQFAGTSLIFATCDAGHPWMNAYIMIADHPYVTTTDERGAFTIDQVPPGTYKLTMWHEGINIIRVETEGGKIKKYYYEEPYQNTAEVVVTEKGIVNTNFKLTPREHNIHSGPGNN